LDQGRSVWKSGVGLLSSVIEELLGLLGIDDAEFAIGSLLIEVSSSEGGGGNKSWDWWHWWESNSGTLPGDWVFELEEGGGIWKSGVGHFSSVIEELLRFLSIDNGGLTVGSLLVGVWGSGCGGGNESWDWWKWWESNSETLPGNWVFELDEGGSVWKSSVSFIGSIIKELL
jgi:hypothetical protein